MRYFLLSTHYRSPLDFSDERLEEANKSLERLSTAIENLLYLEKCEPGPCDEAQRLLEKAKEYEEEFEAAMSDDLTLHWLHPVCSALLRKSIFTTKL